MSESKRDKLERLLLEAGGRFASVTFVKKDGTLRTMLVQHASGKFHLTENPSEAAVKATQARAQNNPHLLNVWDVQNQGWRSINAETVVKVVANGREEVL